MATNISEKASY